MTIDAETVKHVAHLARIEVSEEEIPAFQKELNGILAFIEQLNEVDISGVEPMASGVPVAAAAKMRLDAVTAGGEAEAVLANAPAEEDHYFLVPKVVE